MKKRIKIISAVILTAVFLLSLVTTSFAELSYERVNKDYRNMDIMNTAGVRLNKPTAYFMAKRTSDGEVLDYVFSYVDYDCSVDFPTLECYVGDTLKFEDHSYDNNGGKIAGWDWQYYGDMGDFNHIYNSNPVDSFAVELTAPGETVFYLCVKSDAKVKQGCCDPWSENGNHQTVGKNKWFPNGAYWYFTAIRVVVQPVKEALIHVRYWDAQNNAVMSSEDVDLGRLEGNSAEIDTCIGIKDIEGYSFQAWNVQLPDGTIQYSGTEREACITMASWVPEKYLNIEYFPINKTGVDVNYLDTVENTIIKSEHVQGDAVTGEEECKLSIPITAPAGYKADSFEVVLDNGEVQYSGDWNPVEIVLNGYIPHKTLNVNCSRISTTGSDKRVEVTYIDEETGKTLDTDKVSGPSTSECITVELKEIPGYAVTGWSIKKQNNTVEKTGMEAPAPVDFLPSERIKYLIVNCLNLDDGDGETPKEPPVITVKPSGDCDGIIEWTETDSHRVFTGYNARGRKTYRTCYHTFKYRATLTASSTVNPRTFKSGYGFELDVTCNVASKLISHSGDCSSWGSSRASTASVKNPTKATVYIPWNMTNSLGTQPKQISMDSNGTLKFRLPQSSVSTVKARKIYTPAQLAGTEEKPEKHSFEIYINGGGVGNTEFCKKLTETITINGDMYSDDFSGAD